MFLKRILTSLLFLLVAVSEANGQAVASYGTTNYTFLTFTNATGNGVAFAIPQASIAYIAWCTSFGSTPTSITVNLQVSNDNSAWSTVDTSTSTAGECRSIFSANKFVRGNISAVSGGTTTTVSINIQRVSTANSNLNTSVAAVATKLLLGNGTAAAPSLAQSSSTGNGIYFGTNQILFSTAGIARWQIDANGMFLAFTDNTYDIGAAGATRPRTLYIGSNIIIGGIIVVGAGSAITDTGGSGSVELRDSTGTFGIQLNPGTAAPTVATCGTGTIKASSRNTAGGFTATGAAACTVTFSTPAFVNTPHCKISPTKAPTTVPYISAESTTAFTVSGMTAGDNLTVDYECIGGA